MYGMHGTMPWWRARGGGGCGENACDPAESLRRWASGRWGGHHGHGQGPGQGDGDGGDGFEGGTFGVRRPLRFLAYKLELDERQVAELARILDELKTERAQVAVDDRRSLSDFADALAGEAFDAARAAAGGDRRVEAARRLRDTLAR